MALFGRAQMFAGVETSGAQLEPDEVAGLIGWWDASDTGTITSSGGAVSQWDDKSGDGRHMTQTTAGNKPTTGADTMNGLNVLTFDGGDYLIRANSFLIPGATDKSFIAVVNLSGGGAVLASGRSTTSATPYYIPLWPITNNMLFGTRSDAGGAPGTVTIDSGYACVDSTPKLMFFRDDDTGSSHNVGQRVNQQTTVSNTYTEAATTLDNTTIGGLWRNGSLSNAVTGVIAELAVYNDYLTTSVLIPLENYFRSKWGF